MRMLIQAWQNRQAQGNQCVSAANRSIEFLEQVASHLSECKAPAWAVIEPNKGLTIIHAMWSAARTINEPDLTPMAAVAGAIADAVADELQQLPMTKIIVNNGGDIAVRLQNSEFIHLAIRPQVDSTSISHSMHIKGAMHIGGICTSGLGGRSFTRGVASAVTALAHRASIADAAATTIANATFIDSPSVKRAPACSIEPASDLNNLDVTVAVAPLSREEIAMALDQAVSYSEKLVSKGTIFGAVITVQRHTVWTKSVSSIIECVQKPQYF